LQDEKAKRRIAKENIRFFIRYNVLKIPLAEYAKIVYFLRNLAMKKNAITINRNTPTEFGFAKFIVHPRPFSRFGGKIRLSSGLK
jgi:hypothetical protein